MLTKETEAARYNTGKAKFSYIDFNMFKDMHKYFNHISDITNSAKCIRKMISTLSIITSTDDEHVYHTYIPIFQALGYKMSLMYLDFRLYDSPVYDLRAFESMADVMDYGADKYERNNWRKGYTNKFSSADSLYRHLRQIIIGETNDDESKLPHMGHIMCNIMFLTNDLLYINRESKDKK